MMTNFESNFKSLTGNDPFPWQRALFEKFCAGDIPSSCNLPTGLGKTSVLAIWLLSWADTTGSVKLPRRLIYVVDRRTVVDQATDVLMAARDNLKRANLAAVRKTLAELAATPDEALPFAISTLRGEHADKGEWKLDPARPAIIVGTVDMIGSKVLFRGYGDKHYGRVHHAGLVGHDTLVVLDEAHLSPAFDKLVADIEDMQRNESLPTFRHRLRFMQLSATSRAAVPTDIHALSPDDYANPVVHERLHAVKRLRFVGVEAKKVKDEIAKLAQGYADRKCRVLIYVQSPKDAQAIRDVLKVKLPGNDVKLLTGTLRGYERDQLAESDAFEWFKGGKACPETAYLVCTSAGEVGVDFDADHLICDLVTLDSMIQRFGRVNRRGGEGRVADVWVVKESEFKGDKANAARKQVTFEILKPQSSSGEGDAGARGRPASVARSAGHQRRPPQAGIFGRARDTEADGHFVGCMGAYVVAGLADTTAGCGVVARQDGMGTARNHGSVARGNFGAFKCRHQRKRN